MIRLVLVYCRRFDGCDYKRRYAFWAALQAAASAPSYTHATLRRARTPVYSRFLAVATAPQPRSLLAVVDGRSVRRRRRCRRQSRAHV